jgi:hypothetical protein
MCSPEKKGSKHYTHMPDRSVIMFNVDKLVAEQNNGCFISDISGTRQVVFITFYYIIHVLYVYAKEWPVEHSRATSCSALGSCIFIHYTAAF